ncbi:hypothetical protein PMG25_01985 [Roseofilum sp. BLCC_M114]|uniref:Uncharacterized protein n=1 Tax=Roseofilum capinflatum BLCC-M114 TaxID=3022440 RepID=A0ABT7B113_9CYAN|nr:hypothetical protein [Roseofilum capinflatum]MDJ1172857.1 hypothetical protein [Roseofilum capinflatum BLCC-M114]
MGFTSFNPTYGWFIWVIHCQYDRQILTRPKSPTSDRKLLLQHTGENWNIANLSGRLLIDDVLDYNEYIPGD